MGIERLYKAVVVAPASQGRALIDELQRFGEFHPHTSEEDKLTRDLEPLYYRVRKVYLELEGLAKSIDAPSGISVLKVLLDGQPSPREFTVKSVAELIDRLEEKASALLSRYNQLSDALAAASAEVERLERELAEVLLKVSTGLDLKLLTGLRYFYAVSLIGMRRDLAEIKASLDNTAVISGELAKSRVLILVVAQKTEEERVEKTLRSFNLTRVQTAADEDREVLLRRKREVEEGLLELRGELEGIRVEMEFFKARHSEEVATLRDLAARLLDTLQRGEAGRMIILEGYVPAKAREELINRVGSMAYVHLSEAEVGGHYHGHSMIGEWVNIAAGTTTSNLKTTYGEVKVVMAGKRLYTGRQFLGSILGDHVRTMIDTQLMTGKLVGPFSVLGGVVAKNIPPFTGISLSREIYELELDAEIRVVERMMRRRNRSPSEAYINLVRRIYVLTREHRAQHISVRSDNP